MTGRLNCDKPITPDNFRRMAACAEMWFDGVSLRGIGAMYGISGERVRQLINKYCRRTGREKRRNGITIAQAARELQLANLTTSRYCDKLGLRRRGVNNVRAMLLPQDIQLIKDYMVKRWSCASCGTKIARCAGGLKLCGKRECHDQARKRSRASTLANPVNPDRLKSGGTPAAVFYALQNVKKVDRFIPHREAVRLSGVTSMRFYWLVMRGLIPVRPTDRPHMVTGKPIVEYSENHARAIRRAFTKGRKHEQANAV